MPENKPVDLLAQILKNATTKPLNPTLQPGVQTRKCKVCGAARAAGTDLKICDYCGNAFS